MRVRIEGIDCVAIQLRTDTWDYLASCPGVFSDGVEKVLHVALPDDLHVRDGRYHVSAARLDTSDWIALTADTGMPVAVYADATLKRLYGAPASTPTGEEIARLQARVKELEAQLRAAEQYEVREIVCAFNCARYRWLRDNLYVSVSGELCTRLQYLSNDNCERLEGEALDEAIDKAIDNEASNGTRHKDWQPACHAAETLCSTCGNNFRRCVAMRPNAKKEAPAARDAEQCSQAFEWLRGEAIKESRKARGLVRARAPQ